MGNRKCLCSRELPHWDRHEHCSSCRQCTKISPCKIYVHWENRRWASLFSNSFTKASSRAQTLAPTKILYSSAGSNLSITTVCEDRQEMMLVEASCKGTSMVISCDTGPTMRGEPIHLLSIVSGGWDTTLAIVPDVAYWANLHADRVQIYLLPGDLPVSEILCPQMCRVRTHLWRHSYCQLLPVEMLR